MPGTILSAEHLESLIRDKESLLIYFYSDSCAPCISLRPKVEEMIREKFPRTELFFVNGPEMPELVPVYQAYSFPVLLVYFDGREFLRFSKYVSLLELEEAIGRIYNLYYSE
jgi:thiol-disulfide isomerase/thioredoxin